MGGLPLPREATRRGARPGPTGDASWTGVSYEIDLSKPINGVRRPFFNRYGRMCTNAVQCTNRARALTSGFASVQRWCVVDHTAIVVGA